MNNKVHYAERRPPGSSRTRVYIYRHCRVRTRIRNDRITYKSRALLLVFSRLSTCPWTTLSWGLLQTRFANFLAYFLQNHMAHLPPLRPLLVNCPIPNNLVIDVTSLGMSTWESQQSVLPKIYPSLFYIRTLKMVGDYVMKKLKWKHAHGELLSGSGTWHPILQNFQTCASSLAPTMSPSRYIKNLVASYLYHE
jgi:hypothetical protein